MRIVVDTNVIASAIFFGGKPYQLLHYIMEGRVDVVASKEIVDEYEEIVLRLKQKYPRIDTRIPLQELLSKFEIIRVSSDIQASRDPDDNKFVDCAFAAGADYLVSEDSHFSVLRHMPFPQLNLVTLDEFLAVIKEM